MENSELKVSIYNNMMKEIMDIISEDCKQEVARILDERMEYYKTIAMSKSMAIEEIRTKYGIYNDLKKLI
jgi:chorismate mutase